MIGLHPTAKVSEAVNRKCPARNTTVPLSIPSPTLSATLHSVIDRQTDDIMNDASKNPTIA